MILQVTVQISKIKRGRTKDSLAENKGDYSKRMGN